MIRQACPDDFAALETLQQALHQSHLDADPARHSPRGSLQEQTDLLRAQMKAPHFRVLVSVDNNTVVASLVVERKSAEAMKLKSGGLGAHIHELVVAPQHRRRGHGRALITAAREAFPEVERVSAAYWAFNDASRALFAASGFAPMFVMVEIANS